MTLLADPAPATAVPLAMADGPVTAGAVSEAGLRGLRVALRGRVIVPGDPGYDESRLGHNLVYDRRPAVVVRPADTVDVSRAIVMGRELGLEITVKGGGHSVAGHSVRDGALVIDLRDLRRMVIDPIRRVGSAQGGVLAGEFTQAAHVRGLATPFGDAASVGLGGLTLGGGIGYLVRKHGLTVDSLVSADLVTADGRIVTVSEEHDPDLFWAVRGGGGNFGVATRFDYRLHPVDIVTGGALFLPLTRSVIRGLIEVSAAAPEELTQITNVMALPPAPFVPADLVGTPVAVVMLVHAGNVDAGTAAVAPFRALARPLLDRVRPMAYPAIYELSRGAEQPGPSVVRSNLMPSLTEAAIDAIVDRHATPDGAGAITQLRVLGGAMGRVPSGATAFAHRDALVQAAVIARVGESYDMTRGMADEYLAQLSPNAMGAYSNFVGDEGDARVRASFPAATYERLVRVKRRVDPDNVFSGNHNVRPS